MTRPGFDRADPDAGAAVVWALALVVLLLTTGLLAVAVAQQGLVRQRVATAADMAALSGAQTTDAPCEAAGRTAAANEVTLLSCGTDGPDVVVRVSRPAPSLVLRLFSLVGEEPHNVEAMARAGAPAIPG